MSETETDNTDKPSLLGRLLFGGGLAVLAVQNLRNLDGRIAYADAKGVPSADTLVPVSSGLLLGGSLGITAWKAPKFSASGVAAFLIGVTPLMHNFWAVDEDERNEEITSFFQNLTLLGGVLVFLKRAENTEDTTPNSEQPSKS
ncbi:DoxX family membrane protein [Halorubrum amylolyticum]|uniref:DoxX family membrane protein n=1 Tax=Halorubrum amylolyticum TaxID=2508724 RepID=UPI001008A77C|nr:DoxX family protein [Halorubrum amylolyticum]